MQSESFCFAPDRRIKALEERIEQMKQLHESREELLREQIEFWKSHREWSDKIIRAYLDELARQGK